MTKERELLKRIVKADVADYIGIISEAEEILAQPKQEPVAWVFPGDLKRFETQETNAVIYSVEIGSQTENSIPLYKESPNQKPLSDEWIKNNIHYIHQDVSFTELVRAVEKAHGIGVE